jgi:hypothetical protein
MPKKKNIGFNRATADASREGCSRKEKNKCALAPRGCGNPIRPPEKNENVKRNSQ